MAEKQETHRHKMEEMVVQSGIDASREGRRFGFAIAVLFLFVSGGLALLGQPWVGGVLGTVDLVALVSVFVYGERVKRKERVRKEENREKLTTTAGSAPEDTE